MSDSPPDAGDQQSPAGQFQFGAKPVAVMSVVLGLACAGTLAVVASNKNVDSLSTIALALAIIAFIAQLIVYIAQSAATTQQMGRAERLHTETRALLQGIDRTAQSIQGSLNDQYGRVIELPD